MCIICNKNKKINDFQKSSRTEDGYKNQCKVCMNEYNRNYYYKNAEKIKKQRQLLRNTPESKIKRRKNYIENIDAILEEKKLYYANNREECKRKSKIYDRENKDKIGKRKKNYYTNIRPRYVWVVGTLDRHKRRNIRIDISIDELEKLVLLCNKCQICGCDLDWSYGTKGGKIRPNSPTLDRMDNENFINKNNILIVCNRCNSSKYDRTFKEFITYCKDIYQKFKDYAE